MTDRELLEMAAKAAGYGRMQYFDEVPYVAHGLHGEDFFAWNPLTDDGDALRLAMKLQLLIDTDRYMNEVVVEKDDAAYSECLRDTSIYAATRRAIVRAAAAIGESMP